MPTSITRLRRRGKVIHSGTLYQTRYSALSSRNRQARKEDVRPRSGPWSWSGYLRQWMMQPPKSPTGAIVFLRILIPWRLQGYATRLGGATLEPRANLKKGSGSPAVAVSRGYYDEAHLDEPLTRRLRIRILGGPRTLRFQGCPMNCAKGVGKCSSSNPRWNRRDRPENR